MKVIVNEKQNCKQRYPILLIDDENDCIVLFISPLTGVLLHPGQSDNEIGNVMTLSENHFKPFQGEIVLSNQ